MVPSSGGGVDGCHILLESSAVVPSSGGGVDGCQLSAELAVVVPSSGGGVDGCQLSAELAVVVPSSGGGVDGCHMSVEPTSWVPFSVPGGFHIPASASVAVSFSSISMPRLVLLDSLCINILLKSSTLATRQYAA